MTTLAPPVAPGEAAPRFALPAIADGGTVSLDDYLGRTPLMLALMLGLWCPFCRRQLVQLGAYEEKLRALGVQSLAVVGTAPEHARLYFRFRPTRLRLASDPELATHRAYRVPKPVPTPELLAALDAVKVNPTGELPEPLPISQAGQVLQQMDGYVDLPGDRADIDRQWPQLKALFLIDRGGIVRWASIECAEEGLAGIGKLPSEESILEAARRVAA